LADRRVRPHGYASAGAGAYAIFREIALDGGEYSPDVIGEPVSSSVVQAPGADDAAIAYASRFLRTQRTRIVPVSSDGATFVEPTPENTLGGKYPLARFLFAYVNAKPGQPIEPRAAEFLRFCLSRQGQEMVARDGNFPLDAKLANEGLDAIKP
jgi:phosphate transport system substrate-binding protein